MERGRIPVADDVMPWRGCSTQRPGESQTDIEPQKHAQRPAGIHEGQQSSSYRLPGVERSPQHRYPRPAGISMSAPDQKISLIDKKKN